MPKTSVTDFAGLRPDPHPSALQQIDLDPVAGTHAKMFQHPRRSVICPLAVTVIVMAMYPSPFGS